MESSQCVPLGLCCHPRAGLASLETRGALAPGSAGVVVVVANRAAGGCTWLPKIPVSGASEGWEMAAVGLYPALLTQHLVTHGPWGLWVWGLATLGLDTAPREAGLCQGQQWLLTLDAGCWWLYVPQLHQIIALALLCSPKMYRCVQAWCGHPWEWGSSGGSSLAGSPQVSELERLSVPPASWHFMLR